MFILIRPHVTTLALLMGLLFSHVAHATPTDDQAQAAVLFDRGVHEFALGDHAAAAQSFLAADRLQPTLDALSNAFTAALKSEQPLLIAGAARRVLERGEATTQLRQRARKALSRAESKLARVEVSCTPDPCSVLVDGERAETGVSYVIAGTHELTATNDEGARASQQVRCETGALCPVKLELPPSDPPALVQPEPAVALPTPEEPLATSATSLEAEARVPATSSEPAAGRRSETWARRERIPFAVLVGLGAAAATLGGVTVWSGVQALSARDEYKTSPRTYDPEEVHRLARRTDLLLSSALVLAVAAGATALWWVDWRSAAPTTIAIVPSRGLTVLAQTRF